MSSLMLLHGEMTLRALLRRGLTLVILVAMPIAFYFVAHDSPGRAVRSLAFGLSWAVSTVAFFAAMAAREVDPRLRLAGWSDVALFGGRIVGLGGLGGCLAAVFTVMVAVDQDVRSLGAVGLDFAVTATVAIGLGTAVGAVVAKEMEGALLLFFFAGLQAIVNPFDAYSRALPFWSSRELGTYAIDGARSGSLSAGVVHALGTLALCAIVAGAAQRRTTAVRR